MAQNKGKPVGRSSSVSSHRFERSANYRQHFLANKRGLFGTRLYYCVYCGKLLNKDRMQVDHVIPVGSAKSSKLVRTYIRFRGIFQQRKMKAQGINGAWNLAPACSKCNNKKSDSGGLWIGRAVLGQFFVPLFWYGVSAAILFSVYLFLTAGSGPILTLVEFLRWVTNGLQAMSGIFA